MPRGCKLLPEPVRIGKQRRSRAQEGDRGRSCEVPFPRTCHRFRGRKAGLFVPLPVSFSPDTFYCNSWCHDAGMQR